MEDWHFPQGGQAGLSDEATREQRPGGGRVREQLQEGVLGGGPVGTQVGLQLVGSEAPSPEGHGEDSEFYRAGCRALGGA